MSVAGSMSGTHLAFGPRPLPSFSLVDSRDALRGLEIDVVAVIPIRNLEIQR
jgi:hypothetical protein